MAYLTLCGKEMIFRNLSGSFSSSCTVKKPKYRKIGDRNNRVTTAENQEIAK